MIRINQNGGYNITIYHNFIDEVQHFRQHWWKCNKCNHILKRAMNRKPGPNDWWYGRHQAKCGGEYIKIKEPEKTKKRSRDESSSTKKGKKKAKEGNDLHKYFPVIKEDKESDKLIDLKELLSIETKENNNDINSTQTVLGTKDQPIMIDDIEDSIENNNNNNDFILSFQDKVKCPGM